MHISCGSLLIVFKLLLPPKALEKLLFSLYLKCEVNLPQPPGALQGAGGAAAALGVRSTPGSRSIGVEDKFLSAELWKGISPSSGVGLGWGRRLHLQGGCVSLLPTLCSTVCSSAATLWLFGLLGGSRVLWGAEGTAWAPRGPLPCAHTSFLQAAPPLRCQGQSCPRDDAPSRDGALGTFLHPPARSPAA